MTTFETMGISPTVLQAIHDIGYEEPTPIQVQAIPEILAGKDVIGQAQTGTGKTAAFGIPLIQRIDTEIKGIQGLVLTPTRELCVQVAEELNKLAKTSLGVRVVAIYGGQPIEKQFTELRDIPHIVVGTPGRLLDHLDRGSIRLYHVRMTVLDEADEMLDMGFRDEVEGILDQVPEGRQTILFSATMPPKIMSLAEGYLKSPVMVQVVHKQATVDKISQYVLEAAESAKSEVLCRLMTQYRPRRSMVFCNTKKRVNDVVFVLQSRGIVADGLHGDLKQSDRDACMDKFRQGVIQVLVATDVASRGLDIPEVDAVFNYDFPNDQDYYVHRIGRTGRAGREGMAFTFAFGRERQILRDMATQLGADIQPLRIPTMDEVRDSKIASLIKTIKDIVEGSDLEAYMGLLDSVSETLNPTVVAAALLKLHLGDIDSRADADHAVTEEDIAQSSIRPGKARIVLNVGRREGVSVKEILTLFSVETGLTSYFLGDIVLADTSTYVDVPIDQLSHVFKGLRGVSYNDILLEARLIHKVKDAAQLQRDMAEQRIRRDDKRPDQRDRRPMRNNSGEKNYRDSSGMRSERSQKPTRERGGALPYFPASPIVKSGDGA